MLFLSRFTRLRLTSVMRPWVIKAKFASGSSNPADSAPSVTTTVPGFTAETASIQAAGSPARFKSSAKALPARSVPVSTAQARPWSSKARKSSASSSTPPPQGESCLAVMFTSVLVGIS